MQLLLAFIGITILVLQSVDGIWSLHVNHYDIRGNYLASVLAILLFLAQKSFMPHLLKYLKSSHLPFFFSLFLIGTFGLFHSENRTRSVFFLLWTALTLIGVPFLVMLYVRTFKSWVYRVTALWVSIQSLVIASDLFLLSIHSKVSIGKIWDFGDGFPRPHAWYQEPSYFAAFALFSLISTRILLRQANQRWKVFYLTCFLITTLGILCSTSRLGWIGIMAIGFIELSALFRRLTLENRLGDFLKSYQFIGAFLAILFAMVWTYSHSPSIRRTVEGFTQISLKSSFSDRSKGNQAAIRVFREHPLIGVGPGAAGAYLSNHFPDDLFFTSYKFEKKVNPLEFQRNDPLSTSLFLELLSEWGIIGAGLFLFGLFYFLKPLNHFTWAYTITLLGLVYTFCQTLPRYDLWVALTLLGQLKNQDLKIES